LDETPPTENDSIARIERILKTPGAKLCMIMSALIGGILGILILYTWLSSQHGMPVTVDCKTAIAACKNVLP
jgi:hypothetical protein